MSKAITHDLFQNNVTDDPMAEVMRNAIMANGIETVAFNNTSRLGLQNTFNHEIKSGKVGSQEKSGRCWMFAGLNLFRQTVTEKLEIDDFEFSLNYPMFYDKLEKANFFLESILCTLDEDIYSRIVMWLLNDPIMDGGQWDMFADLIQKYGAVPKHIMPETFHSSNSAVMNQLLTAKLRQWASELREQHGKGANELILRKQKEQYLVEFHKLLCFFLGNPPHEFDYEYRNKDDEHRSIQNISPQQFFETYVGIDFNDYISVIHAPTPEKPFNKRYRVDFLGNVIEGRPVNYINLPFDELRAATIKQIQAGEPVWFGCDIRLQTDKKKGLMDSKVFLYEHSLGTSFGLDKAGRLLYGESLLTHAMVLTGVNVGNGKPNRWKVENSWGEDRGEKGFFVMSDNWFEEYTYQVVVHKKYLAAEQVKIIEQEAVVLPPWDPMGSLARMQ